MNTKDMKKRQDQFQKLLEELVDSAIDSARDASSHLDRTKLGAFARYILDSVDRDKVTQVLRDKLEGLEKDTLEKVLKEGLSYIDRRKLILNKMKPVERGVASEIDTRKIDDYLDSRIDDVIRARLAALSAAELETLLEDKRAALKVVADEGKGKKAEITADKPTVIVEKKERSNPIARVIGTMGRFAVLGAAGWIAYSHLLLEHQVPLPKAIAAELLTLAFRAAGPITSYHDRGGSGRPLVLIHSINAAASSYEMRPLFQHYRGQRPVYALDFPGFGFSARPDIEYKPELFVQAILTLLTHIGGEAADVVALSLGSEFAAEAARRRPELFHSLALISPTGMYNRDNARSSQSLGLGGFDEWVYPMLSFRLWARPFYDLLTTRRSIAYFLQRSFLGMVPQEMVNYCYSTSHQPGAEHAPLQFVSGKLFTPNALDKVYRNVTTPSLVIYDRDAFVSFDRLRELEAANKAWQSVRITPTLGMPQWEKLEETTQALENFWQGIKVANAASTA